MIRNPFNLPEWFVALYGGTGRSPFTGVRVAYRERVLFRFHWAGS